MVKPPDPPEPARIPMIARLPLSLFLPLSLLLAAPSGPVAAAIWHGVDHIRVRDGGLFVKFIFSGSMVEHNVDGDHLRMRSRRPTCFDCSHLLKPGVDVCVQLSHPLQGSSIGEIKPSMLLCHDARLITIKRNHIEDQCHCLFFIMLYENQCPDNTEGGEVISNRREEVVILNNIFLLQKLQPKEVHEGSVHWSCAVDCLSRNRRKLLSARFSQEIAHLIVLSILKGMEFSIELVEGKIIYRIIKGGKARCNLDSMSTHPGSDNNMEIVSFQRRDEALCPIIRNIPATHAKKRKLTEDRRFTMKTELDGQLEYMRFTVKTELDGLLDVSSYEQMDLRRSKRRKTQAERFTSYDMPNFGRDRYKRRGASSTKHDDSHRGLRGDLPVEVESTYEEAPVNITQKQTSASTFVVKENPSSSEGQHKSTTRITHVKEKPSSVEVKKESTVEERSSDSHIPRKPAKSKEKNRRPPLSLRRKLFTSSHSLNGNSEQAFYQKRGRKRKQRMCETEYTNMINKCIGNIQSEMEMDFEFNLGVPMMNYEHGAYGEVNFTWPASSDSDSQDEKDDLDEFWKERDHSWATLALEKNQDSHSEGVHESTAGLGKREEDPCLHDCMQDEELGLVCRLCNVVCVEAKDIFPQMANGSDYNKERPGRRNFDHGDLVLDPSLLAILGPEFSELTGSGNLWSLIPDLEPRLLPHQRKAFEFIWKNLVGSLQLEQMDKPSTSKGGCVVAHTPGSGKTLLLISFLVSYLKVHPRSRPLVLTQKSAIHTWRREFEKWGITVPLHVLHQADKRSKPLGAIDPRLQAILSNFHQLAWKNSCLVDRLDKLCKWHEHPSVLLMTYSSFRQLTKEDSVMPQQAFIAQVLINNPGLLILDEGHNPRSKKDMLRKALMKVKTECRILMSGTVFQNNFGEYFNTLSLARPRFVDDVMTALVPERKKETSGRGAEQREAVARRIFMDRVGQMIESSDKWDRADGISLLNKLTCGFIDSFEGSKLSSLPGLHVYTLFMKPTEVQEDILSKISMASTRNHFKVEPLITIASIHPWLIKTSECASTCFSPAEIDKVDRYKRNIAVGCKAKFVINLLHKSSYRGERVLIFCHNVSPISFLVELIQNVFGWRLGEEVLVLQGEQELPIRSDVMDKFNTDSQGKRKVLIASTTACAEGISLTGASRLVMLDSEWNHSTTRQAIARAFRHGQDRTVYVYLLVASGTWEEDKYSSNRRKAWMAKMVFHGRYFDYPLQKAVTAIDDSLLKELADEDKTKTFHMIVKQD